MAVAVYLTCGLTTLVCAFLLLRQYIRSRTRLLLWSGLCFAALTANYGLIFLDLQVIRDADLLFARNVSALLAMALLLYGLIWDTGP